MYYESRVEIYEFENCIESICQQKDHNLQMRTFELIFSPEMVRTSIFIHNLSL